MRFGKAFAGNPMTDSPKHRYFDPKITFGNLLTIGAAIVAILSVWYQLDERQVITEYQLESTKKEHDRRLASLDRRQEETSNKNEIIGNRLTKIETTLVFQGETLQRILKAVEAK